MRNKMDKKDMERFREMLIKKKEGLIQSALKYQSEEITSKQDELPDEADLASRETNLAFLLRLKDRERQLIKKIDIALEKIEEGSYGICEICEEPIELKRLEARPEASLCLSCKEEQERQEKRFPES